MRGFTRSMAIATLLALLLVALAACRGASKPTPIVGETPSAPGAPGAVAPALPPQPPRVVHYAPERGQELSISGPIVLSFDQEMDTASVERAFHIEPAVGGKFAWDDGHTLRFTPSEGGFARDNAYRVEVDTSAKSAIGLPLAEPVEVRLQTVGYLVPSTLLPAPESVDVSTDSAIMVAFNRPVVPLTGIEEQKNLPQPLAFSPAVEGDGEWINTSIYRFTPAMRLSPGTHYTVSVSAELVDTTGGVMAEPYSWSFTTETPRVVTVSPAHRSVHVSPLTTVTLTFNQPMDRGATEARFTLVSETDGSHAEGGLAWEEDALVFTPGQPLAPGATYRIRLEAGSPAAQGDADIASDFESTFQVARIPSVLHMSAEGRTSIDPSEELMITFSSPIDTETFLEGVEINPEAELYAYWTDDDTKLYLGTTLKPSTDYTLSLSTDIKGRYGHRLAEDRTFHFTTHAFDPSFELSVPSQVGVYSTVSEPLAYVRTVNVSRIDLSLHTISLNEFARFSGYDWDGWQRKRGDEASLVRRWSQPVHAELNATDIQAIPLAYADGSALEPGLYYLEVSVPERDTIEKHLVVLTDVNLTLKTTAREVLVWATDMATGQPVPDVALSFYNGYSLLLAEATTDSEGIAIADLEGQVDGLWDPITVIGRRGDTLTAVLRQWDHDLEPWEYGLYGEPGYERYTGYIYTDRMLYRPGQTVYWKGILRADNDSRYTLPPPGAEVELSVIDSQGRELWQTTEALSDMGTVHGEFPLGEGAALGGYQIVARFGDQYTGASFMVAEYRKPEFQVSVATDGTDYIHGDSILASAQADYFFGGPVGDAAVQWRVTREPFVFDRWQGEGYYSFADYGDEYAIYWEQGGELVTEGEGSTDAQGGFDVTIPADLREVSSSQTYIVEISVTDLNNQVVSARVAVVVHKGEFYIGLAPLSYVGAAGTEQPVKVLTVDTQGAELANQALEVVFYKHEWFSVREQADDGRFYWTNRIEDTPVFSTTTQTDAHGRAQVSFTPEEGGTYKVLASGVDEHGNEVRSAAFMWVSGGSYINWRQENNDRINLVPDKKEYKPGETATILVPSPYQGATLALLTIERGHILEYRLLELEGNSEQISLPITDDYLPNIYVSITLIKGVDEDNPLPSFKLGYTMLAVSTEQKELTVRVTPSREGTYAPREMVGLNVETLDSEGRGVTAEVSLQVVDLALERLAGADPRDIVQVFYRERGIGVFTSATLAASVDRYNLHLSREGKGGGGGDEGTIREDFPDTAFWAPALRTDANGRARVNVRLPDNLTTWRVTAQAVTSETQVGKATLDVVSTLDVLIRPVAPRFMVVGDEPILGAVVHNRTDQSMDALVTLATEGVSIENAEQSVRVPAGGRVKVAWPAVVEPTSEATLRLSVTAGPHSDAMQLRLPVYQPSSPEVVGTAGEVEEQAVELVRVPQGADTSAGELTVVLEPSIAAGLTESLDYLKAYPYDCIEQAVSRFLPNVATYQALSALGVHNERLEENLPQQVQVGLQRIYSAQNLDGGWGWWPDRAADPALSAYVILGLSEAQRAGLAVDSDTMSRGIVYLNDWLEVPAVQTRIWRDQRAMVLYALAEAGEGDLGRTVTLFEQRSDMSLFAKAYLAMTLQILDPDEPTRRDTLVNELGDAALLSAAGAHWEEAVPARWAMNTDTRTTALVLRALVRLQPDHTLLPHAVRWLMAARESGRWETTQENAWSILALTDYMLSTGELLADYDYEVLLNGVSQGVASVSSSNVRDTRRAEVPVSALEPGADSQLVIERSEGPGRLYYSAFLRYYLPVEGLQPLARGMVVEREYYLAEDPTRPIREARINDVVLVKLTLVAPNDLYFLVLEDPLPAGCEAIDASLETTSRAFQAPHLQRDYGKMAPNEWAWLWGWDWADRTELRDDKVALFAGSLPKGTYTYTYAMRCTTPGDYRVMPAKGYEMYAADRFGRSGGLQFHIADE